MTDVCSQLRLVVLLLLVSRHGVPALTTPSWSELETHVVPPQSPPVSVDWTSGKGKDLKLDESAPILFREHHGWCVFSTRVWLALELKCNKNVYHTYLFESQGDTYAGVDAE
jgi:hypothetical protein